VSGLSRLSATCVMSLETSDGRSKLGNRWPLHASVAAWHKWTAWRQMLAYAACLLARWFIAKLLFPATTPLCMLHDASVSFPLYWHIGASPSPVSIIMGESISVIISHHTHCSLLFVWAKLLEETLLMKCDLVQRRILCHKSHTLAHKHLPVSAVT